MNKDILCLFYSQFNIEKGGEIIVQYPNDFINNEEFIKISEYIVPKPELCNKNLSLKLGSSYLLGYPINLTSPNYNRAKFQFNFCLIITSKSYNINKEIYEALLYKVAKTFEEQEIFSGNDLLIYNKENIISFTKELYLALVNNISIIKIPILFFLKKHFFNSPREKEPNIKDNNFTESNIYLDTRKKTKDNDETYIFNKNEKKDSSLSPLSNNMVLDAYKTNFNNPSPNIAGKNQMNNTLLKENTNDEIDDSDDRVKEIKYPNSTFIKILEKNKEIEKNFDLIEHRSTTNMDYTDLKNSIQNELNLNRNKSNETYIASKDMNKLSHTSSLVQTQIESKSSNFNKNSSINNDKNNYKSHSSFKYYNKKSMIIKQKSTKVVHSNYNTKILFEEIAKTTSNNRNNTCDDILITKSKIYKTSKQKHRLNKNITDFSKKQYKAFSPKRQFPSNILKLDFTFKMYDLSNTNFEIKDYLVPMYINKISSDDYFYFNHLTRKVLDNIDGIAFIKKIAIKSNVSVIFVRNVIFNLLILKVITLVDIFQYSNTYRHSKYILNFYNNEELLNEFKVFYFLNRKDKDILSILHNSNNYNNQNNLYSDLAYNNNLENSKNKNSINNFNDTKSNRNLKTSFNDASETHTNSNTNNIKINKKHKHNDESDIQFVEYDNLMSSNKEKSLSIKSNNKKSATNDNLLINITNNKKTNYLKENESLNEFNKLSKRSSFVFNKKIKEKKMSNANITSFTNGTNDYSPNNVYSSDNNFDEEIDTANDLEEDNNREDIFDYIDSEVLFSLYSLLGTKENVQEFVETAFFYDFDISVFVAFGVYKKIIERVHVFGIIKYGNPSGTDLFKLLKDLLDGNHCIDEVCVETGKSFKEVITLVRNIQGSHLIYK